MLSHGRRTNTRQDSTDTSRSINQVVFGFCISDCSASDSNANAAQAVTVLQELKSYNNNEFQCNGGAFFWVGQYTILHFISFTPHGSERNVTFFSCFLTLISPVAYYLFSSSQRQMILTDHGLLQFQPKLRLGVSLSNHRCNHPHNHLSHLLRQLSTGRAAVHQ